MQSAADAKQEVSDEINRTFNMFNAIVIIAIIVSLLGVITLAMSVIERTREIGVLRARRVTLADRATDGRREPDDHDRRCRWSACWPAR